jgi:hypothetical protein
VVRCALAAVLSAASPAWAGQTWGEQQKLTADLTGNDAFGSAVAVSGQTAIVGAPGHGGDGAAYVFVRSGAQWALQQELDGTEFEGNFGASVALQGDTAFVGASGEGSQHQGRVHVFVRSGTTWSKAQVISGTDASPGVLFGSSVALDGTTAVVGAPRLDAAGPGTASVYVLSGSTWVLQASLVDDAMLADGFGDAVGISGDTVIVGTAVNAAAYVFVRSGTTWTEQQELTPSDGATYVGGIAIDGDTALLCGGGTSATYDYARSGTAWTQVYEVAAPPMSDGSAGAVSLSGGVFAVGTAETGTGGVGRADVYTTLGGTPKHQATLTSSDGKVGDAFGSAVALDGTTLVVGALGVELETGAAYVFVYGGIDGDACASDDACVGFHCVDGVCCAAASCPGEGPCNAAEHCQAGTGKCSVTPTNAGMPCPAGACSRDPTCQGPVCQGSAVVCAPADACHEFGACDPSTGQCSNPAKPDGTSCPDGACSGGTCLVLGVQPPSSGCGCRVGDASAGWSGGCAGGLALLLLVRLRRRGR